MAAGVPGYTVAGKTGTAQIPDPVHGGYIPGAYMATFAGFAPAENPALSAIVVLERPSPDLRRHRGRPGVLPDHAVRAAPLRHPDLAAGRDHGRRRRSRCRFPRSRPRSHGAGHPRAATTTTTTIVASPGKLPRKAVTAAAGSPTVRMDRLLEEVEVVEAHGDPAGTEVTSIDFDSRQVEPGALFCCLPGAHDDGHDLAAEAVDSGAVGLLVERRLAARRDPGRSWPRARPGRPWPGWRAPSTATRPASLADRRGHRHERQDDGHPSAGARSSRRTAGRPP